MSSNKDLSEIAFCPHCVDLKRPSGSFFIVSFVYPHNKNPQTTFLRSGDTSIPIYLSPSSLYTPILSHLKTVVKKTVTFCNIFISTTTMNFIFYLLFCQLLFYFLKKHINFIPSLSLTPFYHTLPSNKHPTKHIYNTLLKQVQHQKTFPYKNNPALFKVRGRSNDSYSILNPVRHTAHPSPARTTRCCNFRLSLRWQYVKTSCLFLHRANV